MEKEEILNKLKEIKPSKETSIKLDISKKYKVVYERDLCIGAVACVMVSPKYWEMDSEGKATLKNSKEISPGIFELEVPAEDFEELFESAKECPVNCIHLIDLETNEKLI